MAMRARERILWILAVAAALVWWRISPHAVGWQLAFKALPVLLVASAFWQGGSRVADRGRVAAALLLHAAGDLGLELEFLAGMALFLVGHLLWIGALWRRHRSAEALSGGDRLRLGALALAGAALLVVLSPRLGGAMRVAVPAYAATLLVMAGLAQLSRRGRPWVPLGGLIFVASDALLGSGRFLHARAAGGLVWPLYIAAQLTLAGGWRFGTDEPELDDEEGPDELPARSADHDDAGGFEEQGGIDSGAVPSQPEM